MRIEFRTEPQYCDLPDGRTRRLLNDVVVLIDGQPLVIPAGFLTDEERRRMAGVDGGGG